MMARLQRVEAQQERFGGNARLTDLTPRAKNLRMNLCDLRARDELHMMVLPVTSSLCMSEPV